MDLIFALRLVHVSPVAPASLMSEPELVTPSHHKLVPNPLSSRSVHSSMPLATWLHRG